MPREIGLVDVVWGLKNCLSIQKLIVARVIDGHSSYKYSKSRDVVRILPANKCNG